MQVRISQNRQDPSTTGTSGLGSAVQLTSGTVLAVAGSGLNVTVPFPSRLMVTLTMRLASSSRFEQAVRPTLYLRKQSRKKRKGWARPVLISDLVPVSPTLKPEVLRRDFVLFQNIAKVERQQKAAIRLVGKEGSASRPIKKSYDLDLDEYQSE